MTSSAKRSQLVRLLPTKSPKDELVIVCKTQTRTSRGTSPLELTRAIHKQHLIPVGISNHFNAKQHGRSAATVNIFAVPSFSHDDARLVDIREDECAVCKIRKHDVNTEFEYDTYGVIDNGSVSKAIVNNHPTDDFILKSTTSTDGTSTTSTEDTIQRCITATPNGDSIQRCQRLTELIEWWLMKSGNLPGDPINMLFPTRRLGPPPWTDPIPGRKVNSIDL